MSFIPSILRTTALAIGVNGEVFDLKGFTLAPKTLMQILSIPTNKPSFIIEAQQQHSGEEVKEAHIHVGIISQEVLPELKTDRFCCGKEHVDGGVCKREGALVSEHVGGEYKPRRPDWAFFGVSSNGLIKAAHMFESTSSLRNYALVVVNCDSNSITIPGGLLKIRHEHGYLSTIGNTFLVFVLPFLIFAYAYVVIRVWTASRKLPKLSLMHRCLFTGGVLSIILHLGMTFCYFIFNSGGVWPGEMAGYFASRNGAEHLLGLRTSIFLIGICSLGHMFNYNGRPLTIRDWIYLGGSGFSFLIWRIFSPVNSSVDTRPGHYFFTRNEKTPDYPYSGAVWGTFIMDFILLLPWCLYFLTTIQGPFYQASSDGSTPLPTTGDAEVNDCGAIKSEEQEDREMKTKLSAVIQRCVYVCTGMTTLSVGCNIMMGLSLQTQLEHHQIGAKKDITMTAPNSSLINLLTWLNQFVDYSSTEFIHLAFVLIVLSMLPFDIVEVSDGTREADEDIEMVGVGEEEVYEDGPREVEARVWADEGFDEDEDDSGKRRLE